MVSPFGPDWPRRLTPTRGCSEPRPSRLPPEPPSLGLPRAPPFPGNRHPSGPSGRAWAGAEARPGPHRRGARPPTAPQERPAHRPSGTPRPPPRPARPPRAANRRAPCWLCPAPRSTAQDGGARAAGRPGGGSPRRCAARPRPRPARPRAGGGGGGRLGGSPAAPPL